jgi:Aspartyl protease
MDGRVFRVFAVAVLGVCGTVVLRGQEPVMASVPLLACSGLPCVEATIAGGRHIRLLIDTGDLQPILSEAAATAAGLELKDVNDADGKPLAGFHQAKLTGLKIGETELGDLKVLVADLKAVTNNRAPDADGFLTYPPFKNRLLRIDFIHKTVSISAPLESAVACKGSCGVLEYPTFGKQGPPIVVTKSFSVNGKPLSVQVDSGYTGSLLVYPNAVSRLGLDAESQSTVKEFFTYTDGGVDMLKGSAKNVSFDGLSLVDNPAVYFATPEVHVPDGMFDGTVGLGVLSGSVVTFDFRDNWMSVSK